MAAEEGIDATKTLEGSENPTHNVGAGEDPPNQNISWKEKWKNHEYRRKCWKTILIGVSFLALGFAIGQRGPAFLDLQIITHTDVEAASFFFTSASVGYLVGSLVAGVVYDKLNKSLLLLLTVLGLAVTTIALPWCSIYGMMIAIHFLVAVFGGGLDTAGNAELVRVWGKEGEMAMQFIHFAFAIGGVIGPLATEPFLTPNPEDESDSTITASPFFDNSTTSPLNSTVTLETSNVTDNSTAFTLLLTTNVHYAYLISGSIILLTAVPHIIQLFTERAQKRRQTHVDEKKETKQPLPTPLFLFVLFCLCVFYFLYCSVEDTFAAYLSTSVVKQLHWSKSDGAQVTSVFWASFAVGRFLCIFVVHAMRSVKLLLLSCFALLISLLTFLLFSQYGIHLGVWISSALAGASMAAIFPTGFTWMEEELLRVTGRVASCILIASSSGTMANPIILGYLMQQFTAMWFSYLLFGESVLCLGAFLFLLAFSHLYLQKHYVMQGPSIQEINVPSPKVDMNGTENCDLVRKEEARRSFSEVKDGSLNGERPKG